MGIFKSLRSSWAAATTAEKVKLVLDIVCGIGAGAIGGMAGSEYAGKAKGKLTKACIIIAASGMAGAAGDAASKSLMETFGKPLASVIDGARAKNAETKEETEDGYTRY